MDILYVSVRYPPSLGGGEIHLHCMAKMLAQRGHRVRVVNQESSPSSSWLKGTTTRCYPPRRYDHEGVPVSRLGFAGATRLRMLPWALTYRQKPLRGVAIRRLSALMRPYFATAAAGPTDVIHAVRMGPEFLTHTALAHARRVGVPFVITALHHPDWTAPKHEHYARIYREADAVIALTEYEKQLLVEQKGVRGERVHVTGVGPVLAREYSVEAFREKHGLDRPYVLFVGRKVSHKGWSAMLEAAPRVFERAGDVDFVFIGEDTPDSRAAFDLRDDTRIRNLGPLGLEDKTAALAGCELLCLPSSSESFGGVFTEAWAFGKPVIGGRIPPIAEVIDDGGDGLLSSGDPDELAERIAWLLGHASEAREMGLAGKRKVDERYGWDRLAQATLQVYEAAASM